MDVDDILAMSGYGDDEWDDPGLGAVRFAQMKQLAQAARRALPPGFQPKPRLPARAQAPRQFYQMPQLPAYVAHPPAGSVNEQLAQLLQQAAAIPGVRPQPGGRVEQLGGAPSFFTFGPATAQVATLNFIPFKPCKPVRLIIQVDIVGAPGAAVVLTSAQISDRNQLAGAGGVPVGAYAANATVSRLNWDIILPSVPLALNFATTAIPAAGTSITISPALYVLTMS